MNLDEQSADDAPLHICHLHLEQVRSHFACMRSMQVKHNISGPPIACEDLPFCAPEDIEWRQHMLSLELEVTCNISAQDIGLSRVQLKITFNAYLRRPLSHGNIL